MVCEIQCCVLVFCNHPDFPDKPENIAGWTDKEKGACKDTHR